MIRNDKDFFAATRYVEMLRLKFPNDKSVQALADQVYMDAVLYDKVTSEGRIGKWTMIASGRRFWLLDPRPEDIFIEDIAHSLSRICRFNGQIEDHHDNYSVAQHCVIGASIIDPKYALAFLLHDSTEAYTGDLISPLKEIPEIREPYKKIEEKIEQVIFTKFGVSLDSETAKIVKEMDRRMLGEEFAQLTPYRSKFGNSNRKLVNVELVPWGYSGAKQAYLKAFNELYIP